MFNEYINKGANLISKWRNVKRKMVRFFRKLNIILEIILKNEFMTIKHKVNIYLGWDKETEN